MANVELEKRLKSRHLAMIALGGSLGTGLFLASGGAIHEAGPGGALVAYGLISIMVYFLMCSLGEMAAFIPNSGTFCRYSSDFVDPAFGFAMSWNYWFNWAITVAVELLAASLIVEYWIPGTNTTAWCAGFLVLMFALNVMSVKVYGETEYWLSFIKVSVVVIFIIVGGLSIFGLVGDQGAVGFTNWTIGDAPFAGGFNSFLAVFLVAGFSFQGTELIGVAAGEAQDPQTAVPRAIKSTFWRIVLFYILAIAVISFLIPYNDPELVNSGSNVAMSPFTILFKAAGLKFAATLMNAVILTAVLSACNASMYSATRILWHMGHESIAGRVFAKTNKQGVPVPALLATTAVGSAFLLTQKFGSGEVFIWLVNISSLAGFIAWFGLALSHYRFRKAYLAQGNSLDSLPYVSKFYPAGPLISMAFLFIIIIGQEFEQTMSGDSSWVKFVSTYAGVIAFLLALVIFKVVKKTKIVELEDCQFHRESAVEQSWGEEEHPK